MELEEEIQNTERFYDNLEKTIDSDNLVTKDDFLNVISSCLKDAKSLSETRACLEHTFKRKVGPEDCNFVEDKYVELLIEYWLEDTFTKIVQNFNPKLPAEFATLLNHLCTFHDCYDNFENLIYNNLIIDLLVSESNISATLKSQEKTVLSKLKYRCVSNILVVIKDSHGEIGFIKNFIGCLKYTKNLEQLTEILQLRSFLKNQITFEELLLKFNQNYFASDKHLRLLKRSASEISHQDHLYTEEIRTIVAAYLEPITINESHIDGRHLLEVTGKHLVFSKVLSVLEQNPNFPNIEEVRFVNFGAVHVDKNLTDTHWHGKNLVVLADAIIISEDEVVTWNVSGNDGKPLENNSSPGADLNGLGLNGAKGNPGESGGNVCILYGTLENGYNLQIISNGGNGSQGQDGGNGRDGNNGKDVDGNTFKKEFPPVSKYLNREKLSNIKQTMQKIASDLEIESIDTFSYENSDIKLTKEDFKDFFSNKSLGTTYFEVTTKEGLKIILSFYFGSMFTFCQSYLLIKGSSGEIGEAGGSGGLGGKGGYAGQIQIAQKVGYSPEKQTENGENGAAGTPGLCGMPGKDGLDRGYMDYSATLLSRSKWPKLFIPLPEDNTRLAIISHIEKDSNYVWCAKKQSYVEITTAPSYDHVVGYSRPQAHHSERQDTTCEDQVARKKTINSEGILDHYKANHSVFETFNVENGLQVLKDELEDLLEKSTKQTEQVTKEMQVIRQLSVCLNEWYCNKVVTRKMSIIPLKGTNNKVQDVPFSHEDKDPKDTLLSSLCDRYKLTTLSTIAENLKSDGYPDTNLKIEKIDQVEFLGTEEMSTHDIRTNRTNLDHVENYICNDTDDHREEVVKMIIFTKIEEEPMKHSMHIFLSEFDCQESDALNVLKNLSSEEKIRKERRLNENFLVFKNEVLKPQNQEIQRLLKGTAEQNVAATLDFEQKVPKNKFLSIMYTRLIKELKSECGLQGLTNQIETEFRDLFTGFILFNGPFSETFREFLSYHYNVNILVYNYQEIGSYVLISNHNPTASTSMHFLKEKDKFLRLNLNVCLANMMENLTKHGEFCKKVMFHVDSLEKTAEFENFMSSKPYGSKLYEGVSKKEEIRLKVHYVVNQEKNCKQITSSFECRNDQKLIDSRIEKLKLDYIDNENLLHYMALHFNTEGRQVTCEELCFIINMILRFWTEQPRIMPIISWIIAAHAQRQWLTEFALLELEFYLRLELQNEVKVRWRNYLGGKNNRESLVVLMKHIKSDKCTSTQENFEEMFYLMSNVPSALDGLENYAMTEWKYFLKDRYYASQLQSISSWDEEQLKELSFYLVKLENVNGMDLCQKVLSCLKDRGEEMKKESNKIVLKDILKKISTNETSFNEALLRKLYEQKVKYWLGIIDEENLNTVGERKIDLLVRMIQQSGNTSDKILNILPDITTLVTFNTAACDLLMKQNYDETKLKDLFGLFKSNSFLDKLKSMGKRLIDLMLNFDCDSILRLLQSYGIPIPSSQSKSAADSTFPADEQLVTFFLVPLIIMVIKIKHDINLRDTQKLAITTFLNHSGNTLAQISTGEGKSLIVVVVAIYNALKEQKVNIITSSKVLAERDAQLYKDLFELCGVTVGHNCSENIEERKRVYSNCQVIYGDLANFQRDYLLDRFYDKNILGDCTFETVIIDEVDSMLLDKGANILYLSHPIPGLDNLESLFVHVWKFISSSFETKNFTEMFNAKRIKEHFMFQIFGLIKKEDIKELDTNISNRILIDTWDYLVSKSIIDNRGIILKPKVEDLYLDDVPSGCVSREHLKYFLKKVIERDNPIQIPACHRQFVEDHLEHWIKSAMIAMKMENGRDYVVDVDRTQASSDRCPNITILDRDTGTDLVSSQWDEGLHQFLQLKHGCKLSLISLKNVFISNVSFLKLYKKLHGLTGTLGSKRERELLKEIYDVDFVTIPTAKAKQFTEIPPVICFSKDDWVEKIKQEVNQITEKRSALIICESVNEVLTLKNQFPNRTVHIYKRDYEALPAANDLKTGHIIISTNLAGRGTDIKLSTELIRAGGLHVCLSFLPSNCRVEEQAYGRAARNGEPGTAQMIFKHRSENQLSSVVSQSKILDLKRERDLNELIRLVNVRTNYESKIKTEEKWFGEFKEKYKLLRNKKVKDETVKTILLQVCMEKWTFWLDKYSKDIDHSQNAQKVEQSFKDLILSCESLFEEKVDCWIENVLDPVHLIKLGLAFLNGNPKTAWILFDKVIDQEPDFSETAYYYRVCAKTKAEDLGSFTDILSDLTQVLNQLQKKINQLTCTMNVIDWIKDHDNHNVLQIDSFKRQQTDKCNIYSLFVQSVIGIIGDGIIPVMLSHPLYLDRFRAESMYHKLIEENVLSKTRLDSKVSTKDLGFVVKYGLSPLKVKSFLENYNFSIKFDIHGFLKQLKNEFKVPSRELFWKELIANNLLKEEEKYVFVDMHQVESIDPSLKNHLELGIDVAIQMDNGKVWLYEQEELFQSNPNFVLSVLKKEEFKSRIGPERYKYLKQSSVFFVNKLATFELVEDFTFHHFDSLEFADFGLLDIPENTICSIINDLVDKKILQENRGNGLKSYKLACDPSLLEEIELLTNRAYTSDVRSLLTICFSHRLSLNKALLFQTVLGGKFSLKFLPSVVHKNMFFEMINSKVLKLPMVQNKVDVKQAMKKLYPKQMTKTNLKEIFTNTFGGEKARAIVDGLIRSKWLLDSNTKTNSQPKTYYVNDNVTKEWGGNTENTCEEQRKVCPELIPLSENLDPNKETISSILLNHIKCINHLPVFIKLLESLKGDHMTVETPDFSLKPLVEVLRERQMPINEIEMFSIKGFDQLIILEEKRWTWKTKLAIYILIGVAVIEVVVGTALLLCANPLGSAFISEGCNDVMYAINCMFTGHFSWKDYTLHKLVSSSLHVFNHFAFNPKCVSNVGGKIKSISFKSIKDGLMNKESITSIVASSSVTIVSAVARGAIYAAADNIIEPQLEKLSETIVEIVYSEIDEIIDNSHCPSMEDVLRMFPPSEAHTIVSESFSDILENLLTTYEKDWFELAAMITKTVKFSLDIVKLKRVSSDVFNLMHDVSEAFETASSIFKSTKTLWEHLNNIISTILQKVEDDLADVVDQFERGNIHNFQMQNESFNHEKYVAETKRVWKYMIQKRLSNKLKQSVLSPLMQYTANTFANISHRFIAQKKRRSLAGQKNREINKLKDKHLMQPCEKDCKFDRFHESDFDETLIQMLSKQRSAKLFVELMKKNIPADTSVIQMCCTVIPTVLKKEGISCPNLEIIVEGIGHQERFYTNEEETPISTIVIAPDADLRTNLSLNKVLLMDLVDAMISGFIQSDPQNKDLTVESIRNILMEAIGKCLVISKPLDRFHSNSQDSQSSDTLNMSIERNVPSQHSLPDGNWMFKPQVDFDLRMNESIVSVVQVQDHISKGFQVALEKINNHISKCHEAFKYFKLKIGDFEEKESDIVLQTNKGTSGNFYCVTTKYELAVPVSVIINDDTILVEFKISMQLKHRNEKILARTPVGPHIVYEITPEISLTSCDYNGIKGHILLNKDCEETTLTAEKCLIAGDLILFSGFSMQKSCKILFLGETLLASTTEDTPMNNCVVKPFKKMTEMKTAISEISIYYKDVENVILYVGLSETLTMKSPVAIVKDVDSVICDIEKHINKAKITVCSLFEVEGKSAKIRQVNKTLRLHCGSRSYGFLDTNKVIKTTDLENDKKHIKKTVMKTIVEEALKSEV